MRKAQNFNDNSSLFFDEVFVAIGGMTVEEEGIVGEEAAKTVDAVGG